MRFLLRLLCTLTAHEAPLEVECGRVIPFVVFRCPRCGAKWAVVWDD